MMAKELIKFNKNIFIDFTNNRIRTFQENIQNIEIPTNIDYNLTSTLDFSNNIDMFIWRQKQLRESIKKDINSKRILRISS